MSASTPITLRAMRMANAAATTSQNNVGHLDISTVLLMYGMESIGRRVYK